MTRCIDRLRLTLPVAAAVALSAGCLPQGQMSNAEFRDAATQIATTGDAEGLQDGVVEISTSFTIADGVQSVMQQVRDFLASQVPCSTVTATGDHGLTIDFGALGDQCTWNGHTYAGTVTVSYAIDGSSVVVTHDYQDLTNGRVTLNGEATVTWTDKSRHVVTMLTFDGPNATVNVDSDRTQTRLGGIGDGIQVNGTRNWHGPRGDWQLDIEDVQIRGQDPVPQAGTYHLVTPADKDLSATFKRIDDNTIEVTLQGPKRERVFDITSVAKVNDA